MILRTSKHYQLEHVGGKYKVRRLAKVKRGEWGRNVERICEADARWLLNVDEKTFDDSICLELLG